MFIISEEKQSYSSSVFTTRADSDTVQEAKNLVEAFDGTGKEWLKWAVEVIKLHQLSSDPQFKQSIEDMKNYTTQVMRTFNTLADDYNLKKKEFHQDLFDLREEHAAQISDLENKVASYKAVAEEENERAAQLEQENQSIHKENESLQKQLEESREAYAQLKEITDRYKEDIVSLNTRLQEYEEAAKENLSLKTQTADLKRQIEKAHADLAQQEKESAFERDRQLLAKDRDHQDKINEIQASHNDKIKQLINEREQLQREYRDQVKQQATELEQRHQQQTEQLKQKYHSETEKLQLHHDEEMSFLRQKLEQSKQGEN